MPPHLNEPCSYCGLPSNERFRLCPDCWSRTCGELCDRVTAARNDITSVAFQVAVEGCVRFLVWKDGQDECK